MILFHQSTQPRMIYWGRTINVPDTIMWCEKQFFRGSEAVGVHIYLHWKSSYQEVFTFRKESLNSDGQQFIHKSTKQTITHHLNALNTVLDRHRHVSGLNRLSWETESNFLSIVIPSGRFQIHCLFSCHILIKLEDVRTLIKYRMILFHQSTQPRMISSDFESSLQTIG
jgi:hypothetical protein